MSEPVRLCKVFAVDSENPVENKIVASSDFPALIEICGLQETIKVEKIKMAARKSLPRRGAPELPLAAMSVSEVRKGGRLKKLAQKFFILKL